MIESIIFSNDFFLYVVVPFLIFISRIIDVSIGTIRIIFVSKGYKIYAPILGFFEVLIWLIVISQIMNNLSNFYCYFAYAAGFAAGNFVGMVIEEKLSIGKSIVRIITGRDSSSLLKNLKDARFTVTSMGAESPDGNVRSIFTVVKKQDIPRVIQIIKDFNPKAFYTLEDVRYAYEGPTINPERKRFGMMQFFRKGK
ncbi:DUF2179 domain-containing protein [Candidatus Woesearchaeota archaeon]|nr:DUF2179 domain-containing protein [Candidatus Woesearchaeota archaeon]